MQERQATPAGHVHTLADPFLLEIVRYPAPKQEVEVTARIDAGVYDTRQQTAPVVSLDDVLLMRDVVRHLPSGALLGSRSSAIVEGAAFGGSGNKPTLSCFDLIENPRFCVFCTGRQLGRSAFCKASPLTRRPESPVTQRFALGNSRRSGLGSPGCCSTAATTFASKLPSQHRLA